MRNTATKTLIDQAVKAGFSPQELVRLTTSMVSLSSSEFNKWSAKIGSALSSDDKISALRTIGLAAACVVPNISRSAARTLVRARASAVRRRNAGGR